MILHKRPSNLLDNLLSSCKALIIGTPQKPKQPKETNWKQEFQKPQNENICLTYLNMKNDGIFPILSFAELRNNYVREEKRKCLAKFFRTPSKVW